MDTVTSVLVLLLLTGCSDVIVRFLPLLPLPLVQIALGVLLAVIHTGFALTFSPDVFLLLFIPPLLFVDAWRVPKRELFELRWPVLALVLGLVLFTILGVGYLVHWAIPGVPLSVGFVLAAVLAPTDAVAVSSLSSGSVKVPTRLMHLLEGEALLNDASGLVALKFAVAATLSGTFSLVAASGSFVVVAFGGLAVGAILAWLFGKLRDKLVHFHGEQPASQIVLFLLLLPFAAYLLAEEIHCSGILAAVAAGMMSNYTDLERRDHSATRIQARGLFNILGFVLNGIIFLLLGFQLPGIYGGSAKQAAFDSIPGGNWELFEYAAAIMVALFALRLLWIFGASRIGALLTRWRGAEKWEVPSWRVMTAAAFAGIRGAITLAGALSVPLLMPTGEPFPFRDMVIFQATTVILLSLVAGCIALPLLLRGISSPGEDDSKHEEQEARSLATEAGMKAVEEMQLEHQSRGGHARPTDGTGEPDDGEDTGLYGEMGGRVLAYYQVRLDASREDDDSHASRAEAFVAKLRLAGLRAERGKLYELRKENRINDETLRSLVGEIDLYEASLVQSHQQDEEEG